MNQDNLNEFPWATATMVVLVFIAAVVGGAVVIWGPSGALTFAQYLNALRDFAIAVGILAVGRGIRASGKFKA